ncbi:hypothetical protein ACS0TY_026666 [Phlomoides rotata]
MHNYVIYYKPSSSTLVDSTTGATSDRHRKCHFGIPQAIITDNGRQFDGKKLRDFARNGTSINNIPHLTTPKLTDKSRLSIKSLSTRSKLRLPT